MFPFNVCAFATIRGIAMVRLSCECFGAKLSTCERRTRDILRAEFARPNVLSFNSSPFTAVEGVPNEPQKRVWQLLSEISRLFLLNAADLKHYPRFIRRAWEYVKPDGDCFPATFTTVWLLHALFRNWHVHRRSWVRCIYAGMCPDEREF